MRVETSSGRVVEAETEAFVSALIQVLGERRIGEILEAAAQYQRANEAEKSQIVVVH